VSSDLKEALKLYAQRAESHVLEGIRVPDENNKDNDLIVVSADEFYSVPKKNIPDEIQDGVDAPEGRPHRIWVNVKDNPDVWLSKKTKLEGPDATPMTAKHLSSVQSDFSSRIGSLSNRMQEYADRLDLDAGSLLAAPLNAGAVSFEAYHRGPPSLAHVESRVVALSTYRDPKATDTTPLSTLEPNGNRALAFACMRDTVPYDSSGHSFQSDWLHLEPNIQDPSVKTLRDFADHILNCYTRYPVGPVK